MSATDVRPSRKSKVRCKSEVLRARAENLLQQEIRFVYSAEFESAPDDKLAVAEAEAILRRLQPVKPATSAGAFADDAAAVDFSLATGCGSQSPLLEFTDEQLLFRTMNLLRYRVNQLRTRLSATRPVANAVTTIERMLDLVARIRSQLVSSNVRLVASIARKFSATGSDFDEFSSDGCLILLGAIDRFDYSRGFRFSTYATHSIQRHFFRVWKNRQRHRNHVQYVDTSVLNDVPGSPGAPPEFPDPERLVAQLLSRAENVLDDREQRILNSRYGLSRGQVVLTLREIAAELGVSKERVRQLQLKALDKLRELLVSEGTTSRLPCSAC